jgi:hypothetical protein
MSELWGVVSGVQQATQDDQRTQLFKATMQETQLSIQEKELALKQSKLHISQQEQLINLLQSKGPNGQTSMAATTNSRADTMYQIADAETQVGMVEAAMTHYKEASTMQKQQADIEKQAAQVQKYNLTLVSNVMEGVHDEKTWNDAMTNIQVMTGHASPYAGKPYSPELVEAIKKATMSAKDKADVQLKGAEVRKDNAIARKEDAETDMLPRRIAIEEENARQRKKAGDDVQDKDINDISKIVSDKLGVVGQPDAQAKIWSLSRSIARSAADYERGGLSREDAQDKAVQEALKHGHYGGIKRTVPRLGTSVLRPAPMPKEGEEPKDNMIYETPLGIGRWDATTKSYEPPEPDPMDLEND